MTARSFRDDVLARQWPLGDAVVASAPDSHAVQDALYAAATEHNGLVTDDGAKGGPAVLATAIVPPR